MYPYDQTPAPTPYIVVSVATSKKPHSLAQHPRALAILIVGRLRLYAYVQTMENDLDDAFDTTSNLWQRGTFARPVQGRYQEDARVTVNTDDWWQGHPFGTCYREFLKDSLRDQALGWNLVGLVHTVWELFLAHLPAKGGAA
jgi:hypothetical protein